MPNTPHETDATSEVMDPQGEEFQSILASLAQDQDEPSPVSQPKGVEADASDEKPGSSSEPTDETNDPAELKRQVSALKKELARRTRERDDVASLRAELEAMKAKLAERESGKESRNQTFTTERLVELQGDWEDERLAAAIAVRDAQATGDHAQIEAAQARLAKAKQQLSLIRAELQRRQAEEVETKQAAKTVQERAITQATELVADIVAQYPDITDKSSPIFKAAEKIWNDNREFLAPLGAAGDIVAVAAAIVKQPDLLGAKVAAKARKELVSTLDQAASTALTKGAKASGASAPANFEALLTEPGGFAKFEALRQRLTGTG
jgi:hypothetical protein